MTKLVLGIIGIILILIVSNILRGIIANKTGYSRNGGTDMGNAVADVSRQIFRAKDLRKEIYKKRDSLRGVPMVENAITKIFEGAEQEHLPAKIKMTTQGVFVISYDANLGKYNPVWEQRLTADDLPSYDYMNGCAIFLLIQEKYPSLYNFPNTKVNDIDNGQVEEIQLVLKSAGDIAVW